MAAPSICRAHGATSGPVQVVQTMQHAPTYHPLFSLPDAEIILRSLEGTLYRIYSYTLRSTSGFFDTMLSLPQAKRQQYYHNVDLPKSEIILDVYENDFPLQLLLCLMSGLPIPQLETLDALERVLRLADKWDAPGPISFLRSTLFRNHFVESHPLRCYVLATHFGWKDEAKLASTHTLTLDLYDPIHRGALNQLSSKDLLSLLDLHRKRRDMFHEFLHSPERFTVGNSLSYHCHRCGVTELNNHSWRELKRRMLLEIERCPMGNTLGLCVDGNGDWPEAQACWQAKCSKEDCGALNYDRLATLCHIQACIDLLPLTI